MLALPAFYRRKSRKTIILFLYCLTDKAIFSVFRQPFDSLKGSKNYLCLKKL